MSKILAKKDDHIFGKPNDLFKLIFILKECCIEWNQNLNINFRNFVVNKMVELFDDCNPLECGKCFDIAVNHHFIIEDINQNDNKRQNRYVLNNTFNSKGNAVRDWFCFYCNILVDNNSKEIKGCDYCWRVFHTKCFIKSKSKCTFDTNNDNNNKCKFCVRLDSEKEGFIGEKVVDYERLNTLITYLFDFIKSQLKSNYNKFILNLDISQEMIAFKKIDLNLMAQKALLSKYKKLTELESDFSLLVHNIIITTINFESIKDDLCCLKLLFKKELKELRLCVDCYDRSNDKIYRQLNENWFCEPCEPPHQIKFVKAKFNPHWPAKVLEDYGDGRYNVRFFDKELKRMDVKVGDIFPIEDLDIRESIKNNTKLTKAMKMLDIYFNKLKNKAINNDELKPNNSCKQLSASTSTATEESFEKCNESLSQTSYGRKSSRKKTPNSKQSLGVSLKSATIKKVVKQSPVCKSKIKIKKPVEKKLKIEEKSELSLLPIKTNKRRSKRISSISNDCELNVAETEENPEIEPNCKQIEIEVIYENIKKVNQEVNEANNSEVPSKPIDCAGKSSTVSSQLHSMSIPMSSLNILNINSNNDQTKSQITAINDKKNSDVISDSEIVDSTESIPSVNNDSQKNIRSEMEQKTDANTKEKLLTEMRPQLLEQNSKNINALFDEILKSNDISLNSIQEKLICIKYYRENQVKALNENFQKELLDTKEKSWCVMCPNLAQFYCCLRFYCSKDCQNNDWKCGHSKECLNLNK